MPSRSSILMALPPTRFNGIRRPAAIAILLAAIVAIGVLTIVAAHHQSSALATTGAKGDLAMYGRVVERMRAGEGYYPAAHDELIKGGYGTRSVFNWRMPALPFLASLAPNAGWADWGLRIVALAAALAAAAAVARQAGRAAGVVALPALAVNLVSAATPGGALFSDIVAGILILAAVAAYGLGRPLAGMAIALVALFCRELVAPAVLVFICLAWRAQRRQELIAWSVGLAAFAVYFAWHAASVHAQLGPNDTAYASGWVQFGGLDFILSTAAFNGLVMTSPLWQTAVLLPLVLLGLAGWRGAMGRRVALTVAAYLVVFAIVGKPFNDYWGALYTPLLMLGVALLPAALRDLAMALGRTAPERPQG